MAEYTPTTEWVRIMVGYAKEHAKDRTLSTVAAREEGYEWFDRWLAQHDAEKIADAILAGRTPPGEHVKPTVEDVARQIDPEAFDFPEECAGDIEVATDAAARVLALVPGRTETEVEVEALRKGWDEGFRAGWAECEDPAFVNDVWDAKTPNPYRKEADRG